ncbi:MAG: sigma-54 dependent transcriptional regulator [Pseudomonadota bacterium]
MSPHSRAFHVAIVEDDPIVGGSLVQGLRLEGYRVDWCQTVDHALAQLRRDRPDLVLCDVRLPDGSGEHLFDQVQSEFPSSFLFMTAYGEIDQAVRLVRSGALDYLTKPFSIDDLLERVREIERSGMSTVEKPVFGVSEEMKALDRAVNAYAASERPLLLTGAVGVGKEFCARTIHARSTHSAGPFISVNCALIPPDVLETTLFGPSNSEGYSNTDNVDSYSASASGGTLYVDGVARLGDRLQARLVEHLEASARSTGRACKARSPGQIICSSRRDVDGLVSLGRVRHDLYAHVSDRRLHIPALRERSADICWLANGFLKEFAGMAMVSLKGLTAAAEAEMLAHDWPRNVSELRRRIERAVGLALEDWISPIDIFPERGFGAWRGSPSVNRLSEARDLAERREIERALAFHDGHLLKVSKTLGISRTTLWEKMKRFKLGEHG